MESARRIRRWFEAARRDTRRPPESRYTFRNNDFVNVRSADEYRVWKDLDESWLDPTARSQFKIKDLFRETIEGGAELINEWEHGRDASFYKLVEAGVETAQFSNITGQIIFNEVMDPWMNPNLLAPRLGRTVRTTFINGEKIPGISVVGDDAESIAEGAAYPLAGVGEEFVETPRTTKNGLIVPVTKEAVIADRTGVILERARTVSESLAINKEKRVLDEVLGITNSYRRNGNDDNTYGNDSGTHNFDNLQASNALVDWSDVENALLLFDGMTDPNTGEPIIVAATSIIVATQLLMTARRVVSATEVRQVDATTEITTISSNPLTNPDQQGQPGQLQILSNAFVAARLTTDTDWFVGDPMKAFRYMEVWPITSVQAPTNSEMEFTNDIIARFKVSERGAAATVEPRYMVQSTVA